MILTRFQAMFMIFGAIIGMIVDGIPAIICGALIGLVMGRFMQ